MNAVDAVRAIMRRDHVSACEVSRRMGKARSYTSQTLTRNKDVTAGTLVRIAHALGYELVLKRGPECVTIDE